MLKTQSPQQDTELWHQLLSQEKAYLSSRQIFLTQSNNRLSIIKEALHNPSQRATALQLCLLVKRALRHQDLDIREVGADFESYFNSRGTGF